MTTCEEKVSCFLNENTMPKILYEELDKSFGFVNPDEFAEGKRVIHISTLAPKEKRREIFVHELVHVILLDRDNTNVKRFYENLPPEFKSGDKVYFEFHDEEFRNLKKCLDDKLKQQEDFTETW
jgi:hypothetical protein